MLDVKLRDYVKEVALVKEPMKKAVLMLRGCIHFFPFQRASIYSFSQLSYVSEGLYLVDEERCYSIQSIKEDIRNIPPIYEAVMSNKPKYIHIKDGNFPQKYVQEYKLTSLLFIPIGFEKTVIGGVIIDKYMGQEPLNQSLTNQVNLYFQHTVGTPEITSSTHIPLSKREVEVLEKLSIGYSIKEMATKMNISEYTARDYITSAVRKLGAKHRAEAIAIAFRKGILK